jgi:cobaltochelatase CobS
VLGAVVDAWTTGKTLIIDELDFASPDIWGELHQFFDGRTTETMVYINGPEVIRKHPKFRVIATANTFGGGENQMDFAGTQLLNSAFLNRFTYKVELDYLKPEHEVEAILSRMNAAWGPAVEKMVETARHIREAKKSGTITRGISTRDLLAWTRECIAKEARFSKVGFSAQRASLQNYWERVVVPSADPVYLTGNPDKDVVRTYLELR